MFKFSPLRISWEVLESRSSIVGARLNRGLVSLGFSFSNFLFNRIVKRFLTPNGWISHVCFMLNTHWAINESLMNTKLVIQFHIQDHSWQIWLWFLTICPLAKKCPWIRLDGIRAGFLVPVSVANPIITIITIINIVVVVMSSSWVYYHHHCYAFEGMNPPPH